ncbi:PREDICTED: uncharacterized protein LOC109159541 [Ipomoea nil]|uniref:uncharacterized protein LOC109159541 n=1 Tax=Ipomoea nil TaxID=35883 RepID=UPI0009015B7E|nr:PREDICTED: uncharacterized protein LOC109159541 [Ipomoea nil]
MEEYTLNKKKGNKRARDDSAFDSVAPESRRVNSDRVEDDTVSDLSGVDLGSPAMKHIREDILEILDESEILSDRSGESQLELGYLLEASDNDLGLPPTVSPAKDGESTDAAEFPATGGGVENILEFGECDFVTVGGLFDFPEASGMPEFLWRPESLPAS